MLGIPRIRTAPHLPQGAAHWALGGTSCQGSAGGERRIDRPTQGGLVSAGDPLRYGALLSSETL